MTTAHATGPLPASFLRRSIAPDRVRETFERYAALHDRDGVEARRSAYAVMVNAYYDLVTDFYEYGWGDSFHFAPRYRGESFRASLARHQHYLAQRLALAPHHVVLDAGCGVGGPARAVARFCGARVLGVNNNVYQVERARSLTAKARLDDRCAFEVGDFMQLRHPAGSFDAAFAIESTAHAPDKSACFAEIHRVLAPGAPFAGYEWCLTRGYDGDSMVHRRIAAGIEKGNGLPAIATIAEVEGALERAGFEVLAIEDRAAAADRETPWYLPLTGRGIGARELLMKPLARWCTHHVVGALETSGVLPDGAQEVTRMLNDAASWLVQGGEAGVFTPMLFFHARKPG
ncbi:MAG: methyltransferase domain-containing protein [Deltaproteobacteria bacterium]|nr:methyltransferase domain-containing protein [Nannocystaceae bacterium]